jgi:hypothetical protein
MVLFAISQPRWWVANPIDVIPAVPSGLRYCHMAPRLFPSQMTGPQAPQPVGV